MLLATHFADCLHGRVRAQQRPRLPERLAGFRIFHAVHAPVHLNCKHWLPTSSEPGTKLPDALHPPRAARAWPLPYKVTTHSTDLLRRANALLDDQVGFQALVLEFSSVLPLAKVLHVQVVEAWAEIAIKQPKTLSFRNSSITSDTASSRVPQRLSNLSQNPSCHA